MSDLENVDFGKEYAHNFIKDDLSEDLMRELDTIGNCVSWQKKECSFGLKGADLYYNFCRLELQYGDYLREKNNLSKYDIPEYYKLIRYMMWKNIEDPNKMPLLHSQELLNFSHKVLPGEKDCISSYN